MTTEWQLVIDCTDPGRLVRFWADALGYEPSAPPSGHASWRDYYLSIGVPEPELGDGDAVDRLVHPAGRGPAIWFQVVPERKTLKNRLHLDLKVGGGRSVPLPQRRFASKLASRSCRRPAPPRSGSVTCPSRATTRC